MPIKTHRDEMPQMNLTPMIDVVFQLLLFFMVGTKFIEMDRQIALNTPQVKAAGDSVPSPQKKVVNLYQDGTITVDKQTVSLEELTKRLAAARSQYKNLGVLIRGDAASSFQRVADVLGACKQAGVADLGISVRIAARER